MVFSLNSSLNLIFKRFGLIIGALGIMIYYNQLIEGIPTLPLDLVFGFCLFSLVWGYSNKIFRTPFPSASGIIAVSSIIVGYALLIPAYIRELLALIPLVEILSIIFIIFELISLWVRDSLVPTGWQLQDRFENQQNSQNSQNINSKTNSYRNNEEEMQR